LPILGLTADELEGACNRLWDLTTSGKTDDESRKALKLSHADFNELKRTMFEREMNRLGERTAEETYIQYTIDQIQNIRDLTDMIKNFKASKQYNAFVGAIKARAELNDKLLKMGQELGVIEKQPQKHEVVGGIVVTDLTSKQLKKMITNELSSLGEMMKRHGGGDIIDIKPGPSHVPTKKVKAVEGKGRSKRASVHGGRRVVKEKIKTKVKA